MPPRIISILTLAQSLVILLGVLLTGAFLKLYAGTSFGKPVPRLPVVMRDYGFWLIVLPLCWALAATFSVRSLDSSPSARPAYILTGIILLAALCVVFLVSVISAFYAATYSW